MTLGFFKSTENILGNGENASHQGMNKFIFENIDIIIEIGKNASDYHHSGSNNVFNLHASSTISTKRQILALRVRNKAIRHFQLRILAIIIAVS